MAKLRDFTWKCECGKSGVLTPRLVMPGAFYNESDEALARQARRIHKCEIQRFTFELLVLEIKEKANE